MTNDDDAPDEPAETGLRFEDLDPQLQRTVELFRALPPGHRRNVADPNGRGLDVLDLMRTMRAEVERPRAEERGD